MPQISSPTPDATTTAKGKVQLAGDLSGTAALPIVKSSMRVFNVKDYGALGDGSTNDTTNVQAAYTAASTTGGVVFFPAGTYMCDPIYSFNNVSTLGAGPTASIIKRRPATTTNPDSIGNLNYHGTSGAKFTGFTVSDIGIDGNKANIIIGGGGDQYDVEGLSLKWCEQFTIDNVRAINAYADGFDFDDSTDGIISNSKAINNGGSGIHFSEGSSRLIAIGNIAIGNGVTLTRSGLDQYTTTADCVFVGNYTYNNYRGYNIEGSGAIFTGNYTVGNTNSSLTTGVGKTWTPTFTGLTGGTLNYARYSLGDGWCDYELQYTLAGAGVSGSELKFTPPVAMSATYAVPAPVGQAVLGDTGTASYTGTVMVDSSTTFRIRALGAAGTYANTASLSSTVPFTWGSTDIIFASGRYRIA